MGIGPELPPHLARRRSPSPVRLPASSSSSSARAAPAPALAPAAAPPPDSDSDDDFGPSLPPDLAQERKDRPPAAGPQLPPHLAGPSSRPPPAGPQLPPHLAAARAGPSRPPYGADQEDDDDDDSVGPMPLPAGYAPSSVDEDGARAFKEREERARDKERAARQDNKPKREEWMLVPPKEMDLMSSLDTTKLKSRGFATGKAAQSAANKAGPSNLWTETPAERQQRLEDEALGRKRRAENAPVEEERDDDRRKRIRDQQLKAEVERHNTSRRHESLVDQHSRDRKAKPKGKDDDAPPGIWDRDRDMGVSGRLMDDGQRSNIIKNAKDLGGRFGGGSFL
ncbi:hypothetical protein JCM8208_002522 [Rhodotorula glutinis]